MRQREGWRRITVEVPPLLFDELQLHANEDRVSVARWMMSAAREAAKGYRDGFRFEHHGKRAEGWGEQ